MATDKFMSSDRAREYLERQHGISRSPATLDTWHRDGTLPAKKDGRFRIYERSQLDDFAQSRFRGTSKPEEQGIPEMKPTRKQTLANPRFGKSDAGAEDTETRRNVQHARGGRNRDVDEQNADTQRSGRTGHQTDQHGRGQQFTGGGGAVPGKRSSVGISAPARSGRTGNVDGEAANRSRGPRRDRTRDYGK
jgi:hypothetical protein